MTSELERRALEIWQAREMTFPRFIRRMKPGPMDRETGAWARVVAQAAEQMAAIDPEFSLIWHGDPTKPPGGGLLG